MKDKLIISKKALKGEDGYTTFSIRIKDETTKKLNDLSEATNRSRNELTLWKTARLNNASFSNARHITLFAYVFYRNQCVCVIHTYL